MLTQLTLAGCALITWFSASGEPAHTFSGMFVGDLMADVLKLITYFGVMAILVYSRDYITLRGHVGAASFLCSCSSPLLGHVRYDLGQSNFITLYLGLELLSAVAICDGRTATRFCKRSHRGGDEVFRAGRAGIGPAAVRFVNALWRNRQRSTSSAVAATISDEGIVQDQSVLVFGVVFHRSRYLAFKLGAVPFHMWVPDVYQGAPTAMTHVPRRRCLEIWRRLAFIYPLVGAGGLVAARNAGPLAAGMLVIHGGAVDDRSAMSPLSRRATSSACWRTRPFRTWAFC